MIDICDGVLFFASGFIAGYGIHALRCPSIKKKERKKVLDALYAPEKLCTHRWSHSEYTGGEYCSDCGALRWYDR